MRYHDAPRCIISTYYQHLHWYAISLVPSAFAQVCDIRHDRSILPSLRRHIDTIAMTTILDGTTAQKLQAHIAHETGLVHAYEHQVASLTAQLEESQHRLAASQEILRIARAEFADLLGLSPTDTPTGSTALPASSIPSPSLPPIPVTALVAVAPIPQTAAQINSNVAARMAAESYLLNPCTGKAVLPPHQSAFARTQAAVMLQ
jgi:hypothetical protein